MQDAYIQPKHTNLYKLCMRRPCSFFFPPHWADLIYFFIYLTEMEMLVPLFHTAKQIESSPRRDCILSGDFHAGSFSRLTTWKALKLIELWKLNPRGSAESIWLKSFSFSQSVSPILPFLPLTPTLFCEETEVWKQLAWRAPWASRSCVLYDWQAQKRPLSSFLA